ncbi:MAG: hypothetical protein AAF529_16910, partial [Pseudomonadota bacterium]
EEETLSDDEEEEEMPEGELGEENEGPNTWIRDQCKEYVRGHIGNFLPFSKQVVTVLRLMDLMKLKKAPLNAHASFMEWHLRQKG